MNNEQLNNLIDIIDTKKQGNKFDDTIFKKYRPRKDVGLDIIKKFQTFVDKNKIFYLSENNKSIGLISITQGLISLSYLSQYGVDFSSDEEYRALLEQNLNAFYKELNYSPSCTQLSFKATPFMDDGTDIYVDSVAKTLQASMEIREMLYLAIENETPISINVEGIGGTKEILESLIKIIKCCLTTLSDSAIPMTDDPVIFDYDGSEVKIPCNYKGWNYTGIKGLKGDDARAKNFEPSMYFSYSVSMAYISIYENIIDVLDYRRGKTAIENKYNELKQAALGSEDYDTIVAQLEEQKKEELLALQPTENLDKFKRDNVFYDEIYEEYIHFRAIEKSCGYYFDKKIGNVNIKSDFIGLDFNTIKFEDILGSTTNNALFNVLFLIVILIASGVADDYTLYKPNERYFEWLQSAMQNIYDGYCDLEKSRKLYIIEQYILNFNEALPDELLEEANALRKRHIQTLNIVPLMVRSYNLVCQYLIQYPQKQMINYLELIMTNRHVGINHKKEWCWDKDSYDINVNTLFISSLYDFYSYYEEYEEPYISTEEAIASEKKKVAKTIEKNNIDKAEAIKKINEEKEEALKDAEKKIKEAQEAKENSLIVQGVKELVREVLDKELINYLPKIFASVADYLCHRDTNLTPINEDDKANDKYSKEFEVALSLQKLIVSYYARSLALRSKDNSEKLIYGDGVNSLQDYIKLIDTGDGLIDNPNYERNMAEFLEKLGNYVINDNENN